VVSETDLPSPEGTASTDPSRATRGSFAKAMTSVTGPDINGRLPSCDLNCGQGKVLDRREGGHGGPTKVDECPAFAADYMRVRHCRRLPEITKITQDGLALAPLCLPRLVGST
tara:strand:- start:308 stop:646 length:339 start_codon:yes stop_codon:yes gene_type:complete